MWPFQSKPVVPVLRLHGSIGMNSPFSQSLSLGLCASAIERAFSLSKLPSVAILVNSPGGSPVQSNLIFKRIRQLAEEKKKTVYVFCEDVAASGGYFIACAGDEIYADPSSIVGSIGVVAAGFGFDKAIDKIGVERRVYTSGKSKSILDPFRPEKDEDVARLQAIQREVHDLFIGIVKDRRAGKLNHGDEELFSGAFWAGRTAVDLGLVDGLSDVRSKMRALHGGKVQLRLVPLMKRGLLARFSRVPGVTEMAGVGNLGGHVAAGFAGGAFAAAEERALWARYGL